MFIIMFAIFALSFFFTAGIYYLIAMCFNLTFTWIYAFGIWLVVLVLRSIFSGSK